jgi:hypothetical protein
VNFDYFVGYTLLIFALVGFAIRNINWRYVVYLLIKNI